MRRVRIIVWKDWEELFRNWLILGTTVLLPLIFVGIAVGTQLTIAAATGDAEARAELEAEGEQMRATFGEICEGLGGADCLEVYLATLFLLMFMMLPVIIPGVFAAHSVVGEKTERTLEPLLASPLKTWELLLAKCSAAVIPAIVAAWGGVGLYYGLMYLFVRPEVFAMLASPMWALAVGVVGPLLAIFAVLVALMVSSRTTDPRAAQQLSGTVILPLILLLVGQSMGLMVVDPALVAGAAVGLLIVDLGLGWLAVQLFEREAILTRWK